MEMHPDWVNNILYLIKYLNGNIFPMQIVLYGPSHARNDLSIIFGCSWRIWEINRVLILY